MGLYVRCIYIYIYSIISCSPRLAYSCHRRASTRQPALRCVIITIERWDCIAGVLGKQPGLEEEVWLICSHNECAHTDSAETRQGPCVCAPLELHHVLLLSPWALSLSSIYCIYIYISVIALFMRLHEAFPVFLFIVATHHLSTDVNCRRCPDCSGEKSLSLLFKQDLKPLRLQNLSWFN